jgi:hypothetical protein
MHGIEATLGGLNEIYQDVVVAGKTVARGVRECESRYALIEPYLKDNQVILDVGSSLGYFSTRIAREHPSSLVVSFESVAAHCDIQRTIAEREGLTNLVICHHRLSRECLRVWERCVECIDLVLLLSVMHHFPKDDVVPVFDMLGGMSAGMIVEFPNQRERKICGSDTLDALEELMLSGTTIGKTSSHLENLQRRMMLYNTGGFFREGLNAYIGSDHDGRNLHSSEPGLFGWTVDGKPDAIQGINAWNLLHFNPVWPHPEWWVDQAIAAYRKLEKKSDVRPWNLLVTSSGMQAIDYDEFPDGSPECFSESDYDKLADVFINMKPYNPWRE